MEDGSFYITAPSNACLDIFKDNTLAEYKIELPRTLYLAHKYEVALVEIQFPHAWPTLVRRDSYQIHVHHGDDLQSVTLFFNRGNYDSIAELTNELNQVLGVHFAIEKYTDAEAVFTVDKVRLRVHLKTSQSIQLRFPEELCGVLGFECRKWYSGDFTAPLNYDISRGFYSLYVYCNLCEPQIVGDVNVPLLRTVAIRGKRGEIITKTYGEPHYVPVTGRQIRLIEINIKDDTGEKVPFMSGKVICKLHFRPKSL